MGETLIPGQRLRDTCIATALLALAFGLRIYGISWGLPEGYEEATPLRKAWDMWGWGLGRGVDLNPHFFKYPSLTIYLQGAAQGLLYVGMKLSGAIQSAVDFHVKYVLDKTPFFLLGRVLNVVFGSATVLLVYVFGRRTGGHAAAIPAAFWLAVSTAHVSRSQMIEVDVPLTFFILLTLWFLIKGMESASLANFVCSGLAMGLAMSTKYTGALLGFAVLAAFVLSRHQNSVGRQPGGAQESRNRRTSRAKKGRARGPLPSGEVSTRRPGRPILILGAFAVALVVFVLTSPFVLLDFDTFWTHFSAEREHMRLGHFGEDETPTWLYYLRLITTAQLGWPIALFALAGIVYCVAFQKRRWSWVACAFLVPYAVGISTWEMRADRYVLPAMPLLCLFAGNFLSRLLRFEYISRRNSVVRLAFAGGLAIALAVPLLASYPDHLRRARPDTRTVAAQWVRENVPVGSFIVTEHYGPQLPGPVEFMELDPAIRSKIGARGDYGRYAVQTIPMFQVRPGRADDYYQLSLYRDADYVITTSSVRSRYLREPSRFARQMAFYDSLEADYVKVLEATPDNRPGPTIEVFKNPSQTVPFAGRRVVHGVPRIIPKADSRAFEADFYSKLGFNYEFHFHFQEALDCYLAGLSYQLTSFGLMKSLVLSAVRCLTQLGRGEEVPALLDQAIASAPTAAAREEFRRIKQSTVARMR